MVVEAASCPQRALPSAGEPGGGLSELEKAEAAVSTHW